MLKTNTGKIGGAITIRGGELELIVTVLRPGIADQSVLDVLERQENRLLILGKLGIAIGPAGCDSSANSSSVKEGPIDVQLCQVHRADSVKPCIPMKLVHTKNAGEVDTREKVGSGNTDSFCRGMHTLLPRPSVGAPASQINRFSRSHPF